MNRIILSILFLFTSLGLLSQDNVELSKANDYLKSKGEVYFRFSCSDINYNLFNKISIGNKDSLYYYAYANRKGFDAFINYGYVFEVLIHPGDIYYPMMKSKNKSGVNNWNAYPTYYAYDSLMIKLSEDFPELCEYINIGKTKNDRKLLYIKISSEVDKNLMKPRVMYTGGIHGDEPSSYVLMLRLIDYLLNNYENDSLITKLLNNTEIWINPLSNPDGLFTDNDSTIYGAKRYNINNVDLNRNYPDFTSGEHPDAEKWQLETKAMMNLTDSLQFDMSITFHDGIELLNYPWDTQHERHPDDKWWEYISRKYVDTVHQYSPKTYMDDMDNGVTNGYDWYHVDGSKQDYMNYYRKIRELTVELTGTKMINPSQLPLLWDYNYKSFLHYIEQVSFGINGIITDSISGEPIEARVFINTHDNEVSDVYSRLPYGDYYRPFMSDTISITYSASGYKSKTIENVITRNDSTVKLNIQLVKDSLSKNKLYVFPVPAQDFINIYNSNLLNKNIKLELYNSFGTLVITKGINNVAGKIQLDITTLKNGVYIIKLKCEDDIYYDKIVVRR